MIKKSDKNCSEDQKRPIMTINSGNDQSEQELGAEMKKSNTHYTISKNVYHCGNFSVKGRKG